MVIQCMWCGRIKDPTFGWYGEQGPLLQTASHGICPTCAWHRYGIRLRCAQGEGARAPGQPPADRSDTSHPVDGTRA